MALRKVGEKALQAKDEGDNLLKQLGSVKPIKKVLDEDTFTEDLEKIIERDFFPDLTELQAENEYMEAVQRKDTEKIRQLLHKYGPKTTHRPNTRPATLYSPITFETPDIDVGRQADYPGPSRGGDKATAAAAAAVPASDRDGDGSGSDNEETTRNPEPPAEVDEDEARRNLSLDQYMYKHTSEDNASFDTILKESEKKHREKHAWLFEKELEQSQQQQDRLALPSIEKQAIAGPCAAMVETWAYKAKNDVMYNPDGVPQSFKERLERRKGRVIDKRNTRFIENPFNMAQSQRTIAEAAGAQALALHGKIGVDGREVLANVTPSVNGHRFVATPSPAPGVDESPLMTWGEIDGTPFRLEGSSTPLVHPDGPVFRMPQIPKRDEIALELAEQIGKQHRAKKQEALNRVSRSLATPSPKFGSSPMERLRSMSPAARRLASSKFAVRTHNDKALRESYTPSPSSSFDRTPSVRATRTPKDLTSTPLSSAARTPKTATLFASGKRPASTQNMSESLTDNLLQLPKRSNAADYF